MTASSRDWRLQAKYWYCGISSMLCSSKHHVDCICVGPTVLDFISVCVPQRYGFASAHDLDSANDVSQFGLLERCAFNVIENSVTFSERQYRTTSPTLWRAARFHVRIGWHHRQNNLSI